MVEICMQKVKNEEEKKPKAEKIENTDDSVDCPVDNPVDEPIDMLLESPNNLSIDSPGN